MRWGTIIFVTFSVLLLVIFLVGLGSSKATATRSEAEPVTAKVIKGSLTPALELYFMHNGTYPTTAQGLQALITKPASNPLPTKWHGPYVRTFPLDPWNRPYQYICPGNHNAGSFDLFSTGPDGISGTADDIGNWTSATNELTSSRSKSTN